MLYKSSLCKLALISISFFLVSACTETNDITEVKSNAVLLDVYKGRECSCCAKWITHVRENGLFTESHSESYVDLNQTKDEYGIPKNLRSCHTSVSKDGFVFEGHIPAKFIKKYLNEKPEGTFGLAVPAMPTGSPGMEFGEMFTPYTIYLLKNDGSLEVFAKVEKIEEQF